MINQNQIRSLHFSTVSVAESAGRLNEVCYVEETGLFYAYNPSCTRIRDGLVIMVELLCNRVFLDCGLVRRN